MAKSDRINQCAIAQHLGVSPSTVSKVFSNRHDVSEEMREKVFRAAKHLGYQRSTRHSVSPPNEIPRIGIIVRLGPEAPNGFRASYLESLSSYAFEEGIALTAHFVAHSVPEANFFSSSDLQPASLRDGELDALLLAGPWSEEGMILASRKLPCAALAYGSQHGSIDTVEPDTISAMRTLVEHISALGHRQLAFVGHDPALYWSTERYAGFLAACPTRGLAVSSDRVVNVSTQALIDPSAEAEWGPIISRVVRLVRDRGVTALLCSSDWTAYHVYSGLRERGLRVPDDVSLTGFDDHEIISWGSPKISTMHIPRRQLARIAIGRLIRRIADPGMPLERSLFACELVDCGSVAKL